MNDLLDIPSAQNCCPHQVRDSLRTLAVLHHEGSHCNHLEGAQGGLNDKDDNEVETRLSHCFANDDVSTE